MQLLPSLGLVTRHSTARQGTRVSTLRILQLPSSLLQAPAHSVPSPRCPPEPPAPRQPRTCCGLAFPAPGSAAAQCSLAVRRAGAQGQENGVGRGGAGTAADRCTGRATVSSSSGPVTLPTTASPVPRSMPQLSGPASPPSPQAAPTSVIGKCRTTGRNNSGGASRTPGCATTRWLSAR